MKFIRTCQECLHEQEDQDPHAKTRTDAWELRFDNRKCNKCKSEALDYGSWKPSTPAEIEADKKQREQDEE